MLPGVIATVDEHLALVGSHDNQVGLHGNDAQHQLVGRQQHTLERERGGGKGSVKSKEAGDNYIYNYRSLLVVRRSFEKDS